MSQWTPPIVELWCAPATVAVTQRGPTIAVAAATTTTAAPMNPSHQRFGARSRRAASSNGSRIAGTTLNALAIGQAAPPRAALGAATPSTSRAIIQASLWPPPA